MRSTTLFLCLCGLVFMFHGNLAVAQKPAHNRICHTLKQNIPGYCHKTNLGEQCNYCHEDAVYTESIRSWYDCDGQASGRCASKGFPVCCYSPWYSDPTKLRLAFWWKAGTSCASMGQKSCTHAKGKGNPLSAIIIEEREFHKSVRQQQREKRQQQKERRDSFDFYKQNEIGRTWHRRYLIADEDDEEIGSNSNSCYSSCTAAINKRLSPLMYNVLVNQCQKTCRKLSSERGDIYIN